MRAGLLRHRIIVQKATETQDVHGSPEQSWSEYTSLYAEIGRETGSEPAQRAGHRAEQAVKFRTRFRRGMHAKLRILLAGDGSALAVGISAAATTVVVTDADAFPSPAESGQGVSFRVRCEDELMLVTGGFGSTSLTVTRGVDSTTAKTHAPGVWVQHMEVHDITNVADPDGRGRELEIMAVARGGV